MILLNKGRYAIITYSKNDIHGGGIVWSNDLFQLLKESINIELYCLDEYISHLSDKEGINDIKIDGVPIFNQYLSDKLKNFRKVIFNGAELAYSYKNSNAIIMTHGTYRGFFDSTNKLHSKTSRERVKKLSDFQMEVLNNPKNMIVSSSRFTTNELDKFKIHSDFEIYYGINKNIFHPKDICKEDVWLFSGRANAVGKNFKLIQELAELGYNFYVTGESNGVYQKNIEYIGWMNRESLCLIYNKVKGIIHPTSYEGGGYSIIEAIFCNTEVITTPVGYGLDLQDFSSNIIPKEKLGVSEIIEKMSNINKTNSDDLENFKRRFDIDLYRKKWLKVILT